jgi:hypothetical protein
MADLLDRLAVTARAASHPPHGYHHVTVGREVGGRAVVDDPSLGYFFFNDARGPGGKRIRGLSCTVSIASAPPLMLPAPSRWHATGMTGTTKVRVAATKREFHDFGQAVAAILDLHRGAKRKRTGALATMAGTG